MCAQLMQDQESLPALMQSHALSSAHRSSRVSGGHDSLIMKLYILLSKSQRFSVLILFPLLSEPDIHEARLVLPNQRDNLLLALASFSGLTSVESEDDITGTSGAASTVPPVLRSTACGRLSACLKSTWLLNATKVRCNYNPSSLNGAQSQFDLLRMLLSCSQSASLDQ